MGALKTPVRLGVEVGMAERGRRCPMPNGAVHGSFLLPRWPESVVLPDPPFCDANARTLTSFPFCKLFGGDVTEQG